MKLREFFYLLGLKPKARSYGYEIKQQSIAGQTIRYADWLHPRAYPCAVNQAELDRLKLVLGEGDVAIDIGAHIGDTTLPMAMAVGQSGHVIAFEANPNTAQVLAVNAGLNPHIGTIHAHNVAVTEEDRKYEFSYNDPGFMNGGAVEKTRGFRRGDAYRIQVDGVRLESFLDKHYPQLVSRIKYIKVDAEGYDYYILKSMSRLLERIRPAIHAEVMKGTTAEYRTQMFEFLSSRGYDIRFHQNCQSFERIETAAGMLRYENYDISCTPKEHMDRTRMTA